MFASIFAKHYQESRAALLGLPTDATELEVHSYALEGVPYNQLLTLLHEGAIDYDICFQIDQTSRLSTHLMTLSLCRPPQSQERLTPAESDRFLRLVHILVIAEALFGSRKKARNWLKKPMAKFSGWSPLALTSTTPGAHMVEELLIQMADGLVL